MLCGRKFALEPGTENETPWLSKNSFAPSRLTRSRPPVDSWVSLAVPVVCAAVFALVEAGWFKAVPLALREPLINPGGTRYCFVSKSLLISLIGMIGTAYGSILTFNPAWLAM